MIMADPWYMDFFDNFCYIYFLVTVTQFSNQRKTNQNNRICHCNQSDHFLSNTQNHNNPIGVADLDPEDPYVFGPPGSGSGSIRTRYGCGSFIIKQKE
jgi:hypothetical protein